MNIYYLEKMMEANQLERSKVSIESWKRNDLKQKKLNFYFSFFKRMKKTIAQSNAICCS